MSVSGITFRRAAVRGIALAAALALLGGGCSGGAGVSLVEQLDPEAVNDRSVIVALGDSITFGVMDTDVPDCHDQYRENGGFCRPLGAITGKSVVNAGHCGENSDRGVERVTPILRRFRPSVILLLYTPNDLAIGPHHTANNVRLMVDAAFANATVPIVGTLIPARRAHAGWDPFIQAVNTLLLEMCAEKGLICADLNAAFMSDPRFAESPLSLLSDDGLHPNHEGYRLMAETWAEAVRRAY